LVGFGPAGQLVLNVAVDVPVEAIAGFEEIGGGDPAINPRARALWAPELVVVGDEDCAPAEVRDRSPIYQDFYAKFDAPYAALARVAAPGGANLVFTAIRSERQGHVTPQDRAEFTALLPHIAAAVRLQLALEEQGARVALGAFDAVRIPAFLINAWGALVAVTSAADEILRSGTLLRANRGRLEAFDRLSMRSLESALRLAMSEGPPGSASHPVVLRDANVARRVAELCRLPAPPSGVRLGAAFMLALARAPAPFERSKSIVIASYGLTDAEAEIAIRLAGGMLVEEIALRRKVRPDTIRTKLQGMFAKMGVSSQIQLASTIRALIGETTIV
jgi:DNA-binding CsgD family transcriptional regulator